MKNLQQIKQALAELTLDRDGIDGSKIYLYGEGFTFGETANNALGIAANQVNLYGNGIGTPARTATSGASSSRCWRTPH